MRVPVYIVYAALVVAVQNEENQHFEVLEPVNIDADAERISYLLPKLAAKYRISNRWKGMVDPRLLVSAEMDSNGIENQVSLSFDSLSMICKNKTVRTHTRLSKFVHVYINYQFKIIANFKPFSNKLNLSVYHTPFTLNTCSSFPHSIII